MSSNSPPTSTFQDLARRAVGTVPSVSKSYLPDPAKATQLARAMSKVTHPAVRVALATDPRLSVQTLFIHNGTLRVITCPMLAPVDAENAVILASLGDSFANPIPVQLGDVLDLYVITLVPKRTADALDLPVALADPCTLEAPSPDAAGNEIPPGYDRLGFTVADPDDMPRLVWLPLSYPLPVGEPLWMNKLVQELIPDNVGVSAVFRGWHEGIRYLYTNHGGRSLHENPELFKPDDLEGLFPNHQLGTEPNIAYSLVAPFTPHHGQVVDTLADLHDTAVMRIASTANAATNPGPPNVSPEGQTDVERIITGAVNAVYNRSRDEEQHTLTGADRENKKEVLNTTIRYRLFSSQVHEILDATGSVVGREVRCPDLSEPFLEVLRCSKPGRAVHSFKETMDQHLKARAASDKFLDGCADFDLKLLDQPFTTAVRNFSWATELPIADRDSVKDQLGLYHFARPNQSCVRYKARIANGRTLLRQEQVGEDDTKKIKKATDLYFTGQMSTSEDVNAAIGNLWTFLTFISDAYATTTEKAPAVWKVLHAFFQVKNSPEGRRWAARHKDQPHVFLHMINGLQHILGPFAALGNTIEYRTALASGGQISVQAIDEAVEAATLEVTRLTNVIRSGELGDYRDEPPIMSLLCSDPTPPSAPPAKELFPPGGTPGGPGEKRKRELPAAGTPGGEAARAEQQGKAGGLVKFSGRGKPPVASNLLAPHPTRNRPALICGNFTTHGYHCRFGDRCTFIHLKSLSALPDTQRAAYKLFVDGHADLSWAYPPRNPGS